MQAFITFEIMTSSFKDFLIFLWLETSLNLDLILNFIETITKSINTIKIFNFKIIIYIILKLLLRKYKS